MVLYVDVMLDKVFDRSYFCLRQALFLRSHVVLINFEVDSFNSVHCEVQCCQALISLAVSVCF
jgi:hypothetical protein